MHSVFHRQVEKVRRVVRIGSPCSSLSGSRICETRSPATPLTPGALSGSFSRRRRTAIATAASDVIQKTTCAHDVEARKHVGALHSDSNGSISSHGMPAKPAAHAIGNRSVVVVDVGDEVLCDKRLPVADGW